MQVNNEQVHNVEVHNGEANNVEVNNGEVNSVQVNNGQVHSSSTASDSPYYSQTRSSSFVVVHDTKGKNHSKQIVWVDSRDHSIDCELHNCVSSLLF